jgi:hypothetical protein
LNRGTFKKLHANNCKIIQIDESQVFDFYETNCINRIEECSDFTIAAEYDGDVVACMSFTKYETHWKINQHATDIGYCITDIFSNLLNAAIEKFNITNKIIIESDNRFTDGLIYAENRFEAIKLIRPDYTYTFGKCPHFRESRKNFQGTQLIANFGLSDAVLEEFSEWQVARYLGYDRIWDCGKILWQLTI